MKSKTKPQKVYFLGEMKGVYRIQNIIKYCLDRPKEYRVYFNGYAKGFSFMKYLGSLFFGLFRALRANIVYVNTLNVDIDIFWELLWCKIFQKKIIIDYYVSVYDTVVLDRGWFKEKSPLAKLARFIDRYYLWVASKIIFLNETEKERYCAIAGKKVKQGKYVIIPLYTESNGFIESAYVNGERDELRVCWWGSYLPLHGLENLLEAAHIVNQKGLPVKWSFLGNNSEKGLTYRNKAKELGIEHICYFSDELSFKNGKMLPYLKENCDLAIGNFGDSEKSKNVLINKILDASAMKLNLFTGYSKAVMEFFDEEDSLFMSGCKPEAIATKIEEICDTSREELKRRIEKSYQIYENNFALNIFEQKIGEVLSNNE